MATDSIPDSASLAMSASSTADSFVLAGASPQQQQPPPLFGQTRTTREPYDYGLDDDDDAADELDSLPSISTSILSPSDAASATSSDAQREWEASLEQLQLMLTMVLVPFVGKYLGRKFAYWSWARYMEYAHNVQIRWTNRREFNTVGVAAAAATI